jgi:ribA/ribD-fused uncharacterized protein
MYRKAKYFGDDDICQRILSEPSAAKQKRLGKCIKGFNQMAWNDVSQNVMYEALMAKFTQNVHLKTALIASYPKRMAEASPYDRHWGIGIGIHHPSISQPSKWPGKNILGKILMNVRAVLM